MKMSLIVLLIGLMGVGAMATTREITEVSERQKILRSAVELVQQQGGLRYKNQEQLNVVCQLSIQDHSGYKSLVMGDIYGGQYLPEIQVGFDRSNAADESVSMTTSDKQPVLILEWHSLPVQAGARALRTEVVTNDSQTQVESVYAHQLTAKLVNVGTLLDPKEELQWVVVSTKSCVRQ